MSDFKELIPEFYMSNGEFLQNVHRINFGTRQDRLPVTDVELPPWAKSMYDKTSLLLLLWGAAWCLLRTGWHTALSWM